MKTKLCDTVILITAFSISAFINRKERDLKPYFYANAGGGLYLLINDSPNPNLCVIGDPNPCILESKTTEVEEFILGTASEPDDIEAESNEGALYEQYGRINRK